MAKPLNYYLKRMQKDAINDNNDLVKAVKEMEKFARSFHLMTSDSINDYMIGKRNNRKVILATLMRIALGLYIIKYVISFFTKNRMIMALINDETNLVGNPRLVSLMLSLWMGTAQLGGMYLQYIDMSHEFFYWDFMQMLKVSSGSIRIKMRNRAKYGRRILRMVNFLLKGYFLLAVISSSLAFILALFISYYKSRDYNLTCFIFWSVITLVAQINAQSQFAFLISLTLLAEFYLKNKFKDLDESLAYFIDLGDTKSIMRVIFEHNSLAVLFHRLNKSGSFYVFLLYYFGTPALQLMSYMTHQESTTLHARYTSWGFILVYLPVITLITMMAANISRWAHRPLSRINSLVAKSKLNLFYQMKFQIFIERLSGPPMAYYCLNLFPMNSYEFYQFISIVAVNHILILSNYSNIWVM